MSDDNKRVLLGLVILVHWYVIFAMAIGSVFAVIEWPWWAATMYLVVVVRTALSPNQCPLSALEAKLQKELDLPVKTKFIKQHVFPLALTIRKAMLDLIKRVRR